MESSDEGKIIIEYSHDHDINDTENPVDSGQEKLESEKKYC